MMIFAFKSVKRFWRRSWIELTPSLDLYEHYKDKKTRKKREGRKIKRNHFESLKFFFVSFSLLYDMGVLFNLFFMKTTQPLTRYTNVLFYNQTKKKK
mmetsp:Transcript_15322/g.17032  ORF Transcript_15322/g.17032 Transcript_15322/m.17032 type:complete len:97 (-) Transcript_15322:17-307(-)